MEDEPQTMEKYFEEIDRWIKGEESLHTFSYYCGLETINFPPADQFTRQEMEIVCEAFYKMVFTWNFVIDLPEKLPVINAYHIIIDTLNSKTDMPDGECRHLDFCSYYAPDCIFKEY